MSHKSFTDPVEYLLEREFPAYKGVMQPVPITPISPHTRPAPSETREWRAAVRAKIDARRTELNALPIPERKKLVEAARAKELEELKVRAEIAEQQLFFNQPHACADFDHWGKMAYWSLDEGVALCFSRDPRVVTWKGISPLVKVSPFAKQFADAREIATRATGVNEIAQSNIPGPFIAWVRRVGLPFPAELEAKVAERGPIADWRAVYEQEHANLEAARVHITELTRELGEAKDAAGHRWPWGVYETGALRVLANAVTRYWVGYDPADPSTANTNETVSAWLRDQGVAQRVAEVMAQIIRADGLRTGPR